jgi:hypothetical protein
MPPTTRRRADAMLVPSTACQGLLNRGHSFVLLREPERVLPRNQLLSNPHGKLASPAFYEFRGDPGFLLDERRHTGGTRVIVSNLAISDADALHEVSPCFAQPVTS